MVPEPAQYLLRFDDLCPTMARAGWERFLPLIARYGIRPILAIVPDNQDADLEREEPNPGFWDEMRRLQAAGATIALHGYRHLCKSKGRSLVPLHRRSEFAGVAAQTQRRWIEQGIAILREHCLTPQLFVAPRHGFDWNTLEALREEGIQAISDGLGRGTVGRGGLVWIPQQLWAPVEKSRGLWTICVHTNTARALLADELEGFLREHRSRFTSVDRVLKELRPARLGLGERIYEWASMVRARRSRMRRRSPRTTIR